MAEYWKSTPKYWCKHCACYVRDTKLERQNHEATGRHQGAIKRFLRDLHRGHEREERDKERAQREIARLNGVVSSSSSAAPSSSFTSTSTQQSRPQPPGESDLKKQREQLAELGVSIPSNFRPELAMPGEWTVTSTRVIESKDRQEGENSVESKAAGVRKREETEDQKEDEEAMRGLFKKPRRWGRDSKTMPQEEDQELDALLSGSLLHLARPGEVGPGTKEEEEDEANVKDEEEAGDIKSEEAHDNTAAGGIKQEKGTIKPEPDDAPGGLTEDTVAKKSKGRAALGIEAAREDAEPAPVVFKKRKPKGIRSK